MNNQQYINKLLKIKKELNSLTNELWKNRYIKQEFSSKDWLMESVIDDMFYAEKGEILKVQLDIKENITL